ncbi:hypothetical protein BJF83_17320 [Nocardiopsis sp. CNR-923]|uniref:phage head completion protein n=1 Tax=Nocardiopsis sp. CNR-923 TaxID=1904965 RepID=UPI00096581B7|nr:head-tail adaptor protein [Nocardiopsis sp. CNR-923]OLT27792.1 hypothetical protein BJF83_17320 [Nocardiopsis sp. CNR-923]
MSLLDWGPEEVDVYPQVDGTDPDGNPVRGPSDTPTKVYARVQPVTSTDVIAAGQQTTTRYRMITRDAPVGAWARVVWDGRDWDVEGEPLWRNGSSRTRHVTAILRARGEA